MLNLFQHLIKSRHVTLKRVQGDRKWAFHWHLQIIPRLTTTAGFEMGSGIFINISFPEETAQFLREE
jgi:galactose-1-phosphate uridylyltransferase